MLCILGVKHQILSLFVNVELFRSYSLPFLLCVVESTGPSRKAVRMLNRCIDSAVIKIFKLTSSENTALIRMCVLCVL